MLPADLSEAMRAQHPDRLPPLDGPELERALHELKLYLTDERTRVQMQLKTLAAQQAKLAAEKTSASAVASDSDTPDGGGSGAGGDGRRARTSRLVDGSAASFESREFVGRSVPAARSQEGPLGAQLTRVLDELKQARILASIVDTTLLKCYLQVLYFVLVCLPPQLVLVRILLNLI